MRAIPQTPWKTDVRNHRLARQQVVCLASGVSPRRSDEGYERANGSMAVVPSSPRNVRGPVTRRMRHSPADNTVLPTSRPDDAHE
jgi:hypothetical protein